MSGHRGRQRRGGESTETSPTVRISDQLWLKNTRLASDLVGAEVLAVVEEVAAQCGADAPVVGALELVLLTGGDGGEQRWGGVEGKGASELMTSSSRLASKNNTQKTHDS